jgi:uncharacterized cupredoxin-like copper-binding protein
MPSLSLRSARRSRAILLLAVVSAVVAFGCGRDTGGARVVDVDMVELGFRPDHVTVEAGETVRFRFHNRDRVDHEAVIGDLRVQAEHAAHIDDPDAVHDHDHGVMTGVVAPGRTVEVTFTASRPATLVIACHLDGHYAAGMRAVLEVTGDPVPVDDTEPVDVGPDGHQHLH